MRRYLIHSLFICFILFGITTKSVAQVEEDSLFTEIDSILSLEVEEEKYLSSASKYDQTPDEAPSSISIVNSTEIEAYGYQSLTELLNYQRGFYFSNDRTSDYVGVRGFGRSSDHNNRILLLLDGHRLNPYQVDYAPIGIVTGINLGSIERVEIVRGPGSTLYGNNAVHGVINLITKKDRNSYLPMVDIKYGSNNSKLLALHTTKQFNNDISLSLIGNYYNSDGEDIYFSEFDKPDQNNGIAENLDGANYQSLFSNLKFYNFELSGMLKSSSKDIPSAPFNSEFNKPHQQFSDAHFIDLSWSPALSYDKTLKIKLDYDYQEYGTNLPIKLIQQDFNFIGRTHSLGGDAQFIWDILPNNRIITGIEYKDNFESSYKYYTGDLIIIDDNWSYKLFSIFVQNEFQYNADLSLFFGLRRDDFVGQEISLNPRAGIVYSPFADHTFKILYGRSFRAPNLLERNLEDRNVVGYKKNESLTSEFINTLELIWNYSITSKLRSSMNFYLYKMENLIDQVEDPLDDLYQYVNIGTVNAAGFEFEVNYNFSRGASYIRYSYQKNADEEGNGLSNSPEHLIKIGGYSKLYGILNGSLQLSYESKRKTIYNEFTKPILYSRLNLYTDKLFDKFSFSLMINNLLNKTIKHPAGFELIQKSIIQPKRNFLFSINFDL